MALPRDPRNPKGQSLAEMRAARAAQAQLDFARMPAPDYGLESSMTAASRQALGIDGNGHTREYRQRHNIPDAPEVPIYDAHAAEAYAAEQRRLAARTSGERWRDNAGDFVKSLGDMKGLGMDIEKAFKTPINPAVGLRAGLASQVPLIRNYGATAAGALQRVGAARFAVNPTVQMAKTGAVLNQASVHAPSINDIADAVENYPDPNDMLRGQAFDPSVEEASGANGENVNHLPDFSNVRDGTDDPVQRQSVGDINSRSSGLTRIVKTGDGSYSNMPGAVGESRYYDEMGNRADRAAPSNVARGTSVADYNRLQNEGPDLSQTYEGQLAMNKQGADSLTAVREHNRVNGLRREEQALADMDPQDRAAMLIADTKEQGANNRLLAQIQSSEKIAAGSQGLTRDATEARIHAERNKLLRDPETRAPTIRGFMDNVAGLSVDEQKARFATDEGQQILSEFKREIASKGNIWDAGVQPEDLKEMPWLLSFMGEYYNSNAPLLGAKYRLGDTVGGSEQMRAIKRASLLRKQHTGELPEEGY